MTSEVERIRNIFFEILLNRLDEFNQDLLADFDEDDYYSPNDFVFCLSPVEYKTLKDYKNEKANKC